MPATQEHSLLAIGTVLGGDKLLAKSFAITEELGRMFQVEVELLSEDHAVDFDKLIGTNATVRLELHDKKTRYFNGFISRFSQGGHQGKYTRYRAEIVPWLWFLTRTADCRIFQKKKVPQIIEEVFKGHGFTDYKLRLTGAHPEWEYCVQYRETDFNFVSRLMEQEGITYFFEHKDGAHTLILADAAAAHEAYPGGEEFTFRTESHIMDDFVTDWVIEKEVQPGVCALSDFNFKNPGSPIVVNSNITRHHESAGFEVFDSPGEYDERADGEAYAKLRIEELQVQYETLSAQTSLRVVSTGCKFKLTQHPRNDQNREYLITSSWLRISAGDPETSGSDQEQDFVACSFTAIPAAQPFRTARTTPKPLIQGPQTAMVVGKAGEEIDPDEFGRVKVQFHWDRYGKVDENSSCWVRVSQPTAGKGWGFITVPRIGQEVVVEFLEGDPDQPIITGRVYNATNKVPYPLGDNKTISAFKSNSSKGGQGFNELRFEDKKGEEQIYMHGQKNMDVRVKNDFFETIENERHLVVKKNQIEHVENNREEVVDADHKEKIGKDRHLKVIGMEAKDVGKSLSLTVGGNVIEVFKAKHSEQTTGDYYLKADNIVIEGATNVTIKVGQSYIAIESGGIEIGTTGTLDLKSTGALTAKSDATADFKSPKTTVNGDGMTTIKGGSVMIN